MGFVDIKPRRASITQYFSTPKPTLRKRAQTLHSSPSIKRRSILQNELNPEHDPQTLDRKSLLKLSISAPLPEILSLPSRVRNEGSEISLRTSFIDTRPYEDLSTQPRSTRKLQFIVPDSVRSHPSTPIRSIVVEDDGILQTRTVARLSISTGQLYYIEEPIPASPTRSGPWFSPPPSPSPSHSYLLHPRINTSIYSTTHTPRPRSYIQSSNAQQRSGGGRPRSSSSSLYTLPSEKLYARWATFALSVRFSMFRAQDKVRGGVARMEGVIKRVGGGRR